MSAIFSDNVYSKKNNFISIIMNVALCILIECIWTGSLEYYTLPVVSHIWIHICSNSYLFYLSHRDIRKLLGFVFIFTFKWMGIVLWWIYSFVALSVKTLIWRQVIVHSISNRIILLGWHYNYICISPEH